MIRMRSYCLNVPRFSRTLSRSTSIIRQQQSSCRSRLTMTSISIPIAPLVPYSSTSVSSCLCKQLIRTWLLKANHLRNFTFRLGQLGGRKTKTKFLSVPTLTFSSSLVNVNINFQGIRSTEPVLNNFHYKDEYGVGVRVNNDLSKLQRFLENIQTIMRAVNLSVLYIPLLLLYPVSFIHSSLQSIWLSLMFKATQRAGGAFIKLGQWASTRQDLFTPEFCTCFSRLHHRVDPHPWKHTHQILIEDFGQDYLDFLGLKMNQKAIGSGCIAQVYKGSVSAAYKPSPSEIKPDEDNAFNYANIFSFFSPNEDKHNDLDKSGKDSDTERLSVAIKVLHPNIRQKFHRDLKLMKVTAKTLTWLIPNLHWVSLTQCVEDFTYTLNQQLDLLVEGNNLKRFSENFKNKTEIRVPEPLEKLSSSNVLIETFEEGVSMVDVLSDSSISYTEKQRLSKLGVELILKMVFEDNFVHADLHPGNLLVQNLTKVTEDKTQVLVGSPSVSLVLLDCGITTTLTDEDKAKFREVFLAIVKGDGLAVADLFLSKSHVNECKDKDLFRTELAQVVKKGRENLTNISKIKVAELMHEVFGVVSRHRIQLESSFATIVLAMAMLEGLGRSLDPQMNLLDSAKTFLLAQTFG